MDKLLRALNLLVLEQQPTEELPSLATDALVEGVDSPALRELAGTPAANYQDARDLFVRAVEELGLAVPSPEQARWALVRGWARDMLDGRLTPYEASRRIWWGGWEELGRPDELTPFVGLASEWEDDEVRRPLYERDMVHAARRLLSGSA